MSINPVTRPGSVTIVVVLTWINAVLHLLTGCARCWSSRSRSAPPGPMRPPAASVRVSRSVSRIVYLIIGAVTAFVATRLGRGGRGSRMLLTIIEVITIVVNVITWISNNTGQQAASSIIGIVIAGVILALLWNQRANDFFNAS